MKHFYRVLTCFFLFLFYGPLPGFSESTDQAVRELQTLYKSGLISREECVVRQIESLFNTATDGSVSKSSGHKTASGRSLTPLLKEAVQNYMFYSDESRRVVDRFLMRPDSYDDVWPWSASIPFYLPSDVRKFSPLVSEYPHIGGKYTFWYVTHSQPDSGGHVHTVDEAFVTEVAKAFEASYTDFVVDMGFPAPVSDAGQTDNGGDGKRDVYLMNCGSYGLYGYTTPITDDKTCPAFMVLDNDFEEFETSYISSLDAMRVTVAHEFHHTVQFSINSYTDIWIMEATSCWAESLVYPDVKDNIQYLNGDDGFFALPDVSLDDEDIQIYNSWIFLKYMSLLWGDEAVAQIWDYLEDTGYGMDAVSSVLEDNNKSLKESFTDFALKNYSQTGFYPDAEDYDDVHISNSNGQTLDYSSSSSHLIKTTTVRLNHLASKYYKYIPGSSLKTARLLIEVNGASSTKFSAAVIVKGKNGTFTEHPVSLNTDNDGYVYVDDFLKSVMDEVVLAVVNYSVDEENLLVSVTGGIGLNSDLDGQGDDDTSDGNVTGAEGDNGGGCFVSSGLHGVF